MASSPRRRCARCEGTAAGGRRHCRRRHRPPRGGRLEARGRLTPQTVARCRSCCCCSRCCCCWGPKPKKGSGSTPPPSPPEPAAAPSPSLSRGEGSDCWWRVSGGVARATGCGRCRMGGGGPKLTPSCCRYFCRWLRQGAGGGGRSVGAARRHAVERGPAVAKFCLCTPRFTGVRRQGTPEWQETSGREVQRAHTHSCSSPFPTS